MRWWRSRRSREDELDRELRAHLELEAEEQRESGLATEDARHAALRAFGNVTLVKETTRAAWGWSWLETLAADARYGIRLLRRSPAFTLFTVASLALGIGATSAIFSLFDAIVLRELPVREPKQLVLASMSRAGANQNYSLPYPNFERMRDGNTTLDGLFAVYPIPRINVAWSGQAELGSGMYATGDYHRVLRLEPALGRLLTRDDDRPGNAVAVLSHAYWQRRFGGSREALGAGIALNGIPFTVVGVEPAGFVGVEVGRIADLTVPMRALELLSEEKPLWNEPFATWIYVMGRLKSGVPLQKAEQELNLLFLQLNAEAARSAPSQTRGSADRMARELVLRLEPGATGTVSDLRASYQRWLRLVLMLLAAVLLLASLNVATLLLSRSEARQREIATRLALGAGRWRIVRQLLTESVLLAGLGGALGLAISWWGGRTLLGMATAGADRAPLEITPDLRVTAFTLTVSVLTCVVFGLIPALRATSTRPLVLTREVGGGRRRFILDRGLVGAQVALSLALLVLAGLFLRSLERIWALDTGYDRSSVLMFSVDAKLAGKRGDDVPNTYRRLLDALSTIPGAQAVAVSAVRPVSDSYYFVSSVTANDRRVRVAFNNVGPGYFSTLRIPLAAGRDFDWRDHRNAPKVAIISEKLARHLGGNPIGQRITMARGEVCEVVGVAKDTRYANVKDAPREVVYRPLFQGDPKSMWYTPTFEIRYAGSAAEVLRAAREAVARTDAGLTLFRATTLEVQTEQSLSRERLLALLASYFGGFALLLACIGLYGLMSYAVARRTPELGLRMALGARPAAVQWMVLRESAATVLAGVCVGLAASFGAVRLVESQLFGVERHDPAVFGAATLLLVAMALAAAYLPAARASRIDPMTALRNE